MVFYSDFFNLFLTYFKFIYFLENFFLQLIILYTIIILYNNNNIYYILLYFFILIIFFGIFICYINLELFSGFLWVAEFTIIFITLILLFYLNIDGLIFKYNNKIDNTKIILLVIFIFLINFNLSLFSSLENNSSNFFNLFEDYYEAINNNYSNDFIPLFISYYSLNSLNFIILGLLLLVGSIFCINLYKFNKLYSIFKQPNLLNIFNFFNDFINLTFIRKQNLHKQSNFKVSLKIFKNKY